MKVAMAVVTTESIEPAARRGMLAFLYNDRLIRACSLVTFLCTAWQIVSLGFYLDDWTFIILANHFGAAFSLERWRYCINMTLGRPGETPLWFLLSSLLGEDTVLWHMTLFGVNLLAVSLLSRIVSLLMGKVSDSQAKVLWLSALLWLVLPWNAPFHFWPTDVPIILLLALFGAVLSLAIDRWKQGSYALWLPFAGYLWACISYEAVYFQWLPAALLVGTLVWEKRVGVKSAVWGIAPFVAGQGCAAAWYMVSVRLNAGFQNRIIPTWRSVFLQNLSRLPSEMWSSTQETGWLAAAGFILWLTIVGTVYARALTDKQSRTAAVISLARVGACLSGAVISVLAFSLGGRPIVGVGVEARSFLFVSFWMVAAVSLASAYCSGWHERFRPGKLHSRALTLALVVTGSALLIGHLLRAEEWAQGWRIQQKILAEAPVMDMRQMAPGAGVLVLKPWTVHGVPTFAQTWDTKTALELADPGINGHYFEVYNPWRGPVKWDGKRLVYSDGTEFAMPDLYIWRPLQREFFRAPRAFDMAADFVLHQR